MRYSYSVLVACALLMPIAAGCGVCIESPAPTSTASIDGRAFQLSTEPAASIGVMHLKETAQDGDAVNLVGRIGGGQKPWIDGRAAFLLVDDGVAPTCRDEECGDDCAECAAALAEATTLVKFVDAQGKVLAADARTLLGVEDFQTVVVQGIARKDAAGNVNVVADGIYIRR
ncbi:MAG TPA: hypothetical protein VL096_20575 [Pirellulaceae bacterium]|nr:hypothetical protein [Pirellulaceae bacterium]